MLLCSEARNAMPYDEDEPMQEGAFNDGGYQDGYYDDRDRGSIEKGSFYD